MGVGITEAVCQAFVVVGHKQNEFSIFGKELLTLVKPVRAVLWVICCYSIMASSEVFEVVLNGGAPWGFRLQGGKEFRAPLRIAKVTPNSKAEKAGIMEGWLVRSINSVNCEDWTHSDVLNSIKKSGATLKLILCSKKPTVSSPESYSGNSTSFLSSALTTDDINRGSSSHISRATFKPSDSANVPSYATMPRGGERSGNVIKRWKEVEENNNENAFISDRGQHMVVDSNEWNPDIISGVVRPPEPIKLVHDLEAIRSVSSSSTSSEPGTLIRAPETSRGFTDKPRPIGRGGRRFDDRGFQTTGSNPQLHSGSVGSVGSEEDYNMQLANGDASSSDSAFSATNRPAMQQFRKQKEQAAVEATKEPRPIRKLPPPPQTKPARTYSEERKMSDSNPLAPHRPSIQRGGKWYKEMFKELHSNAGTSSNLSGLLASDVAKGNVRDHEGGSGSLSPPRSASPTLDYQDNEVFSNKTNFIQEEPVRHTSTNQVSSKPSLPWSSSDRKPSRPSAGHVPAWYKDMQKGVEVPVQTIEEPESYTVKRSRPSADISKERRIVEPVPFATSATNVSHSHKTYTEPQRSPNSVTVQMEEKNKPPSATSLYESRFQRRQGPTRTASEELQVSQQPPSDEEMIRRREEEARRRKEEEEWRRRMEEEERRRREEELLRKEKEERQRREYEAELWRRREEEEVFRREAKPQFMAWALYSFQSQTPKELSFRKGDIITVRRRVDKNWIDGELNGRRGIFPANYVELRPVDDDEDDEPATPPPGQQQITRVHVITQQQQQEQQRSPPAHQQPQVQQISQYQAPQQTAQSVTVEGEAQVRYTFKAETTRELPCSKGDIIALVRKVDKNWYEGRVRDRKGIVPSSYLEVFREPGVQVLREEHFQPVQSTRVEQIPDYRQKEPSYDHRSQELRSPPVTAFTGHASPKTTQVKYIEETDEPYFGASGVGVVAHAMVDEPMRLGHVQGERFRALYSYEPENDDELRLEEGDEVIVLEKCDDGWYVGTSSQTNLFGTFPGNYVAKIS